MEQSHDSRIVRELQLLFPSCPCWRAETGPQPPPSWLASFLMLLHFLFCLSNISRNMALMGRVAFLCLTRGWLSCACVSCPPYLKQPQMLLCHLWMSLSELKFAVSVSECYRLTSHLPCVSVLFYFLQT